MNHPLLETEPDGNHSYEHLRTALGELDQILENLKSQPSSQPFVKATSGVQDLGEFNPSLDRQWNTDQQKILASALIRQGVGAAERSILTVGQNGMLIAYDIDSGLKYEAIMVGKGNNLAIATSPEGGLVAVGGLGCTVDVYPINEALQADFGLERARYDFNYKSFPPELQQDHCSSPKPNDNLSSPTSPTSPTSPEPPEFPFRTSPIEALFKDSELPPIDPEKINTQRELARVNVEDAMKLFPGPNVSKSHRFVPQGSTGVTNLHISFSGHNGSVQALEFLDEYHLVSGAADCSLISWDLSVGKPTHLFKGHQGPVNRISGLDNNTFVSVGGDGYILLWDNRTPQPQFSFETTLELPVNSVATVIPGICFATAVGSHVECFDVRSVSSLFYTPSISSNGDLATLGVSDSGRMVAAGDHSGMCGVVDVLRGQWRGTFRAHNDIVTSSHIYGSKIITTSFDSAVKLWKPSRLAGSS